MKAKKIKNLAGFKGEAILYEVDPSVKYMKWDGGDKPTPKETKFVVVSAVVSLSGSETFIFPADAKGEIVSWSELEGSYRDGLNHEEALSGAGYILDN